MKLIFVDWLLAIGDERVGPVVMIEVAKLLVSAAACESGGRFKQTEECEILTSKYTRQQISWLARLVSTRRIIIVPAANSKGYYYRERGELLRTQFDTNNQWIDPNRDFSFDNSPNNCMRTIAARSVNEIFRKYLIQMSMTYHAGIENISFEWGATSVPRGKVSPDDIAQRIIAEKMSDYAGKLYAPANEDQFYEYGDMNSILYGVYGGFEDWVYAGSWLTDYTVQCSPSTYGGYDLSKTTYDDVTLNTFNILVEISSSKDPNVNKLGTDKNLLNAPFEFDNNKHNGYVAKHIRTALMSVDTVEPYLQITSLKKKVFRKELKPLRQLTDRWCKNKLAGKQRRGGKARIEWSVSGSYNVDETFLVYGLWSDFPKQFNCVNQVSHDDITAILNNSSGKFKTTKVQTGDTKWSDPMSELNPTFKARAKISNQFSVGDKVAVFAVAKVDQDWVNQPSTTVWPENTSVQSHMVKIRTDPTYVKTKGTEREVQGRLYWISVPVTILVR